MMGKIMIAAILIALLLAGCSYPGYSVKSYVGTTEPDNPQHRLVTMEGFQGQRESKYDFKLATAITVELQATNGSLDFELRSPSGQSIATLSSNGQVTRKTLDGKFEAGSYVLVFKSLQASSANIKVLFD